ncbi:glycosyltransferase family 4 protein [Pelagimonas sp. KU-00592-HH]|uniref:glycosyltransferase family 4 protein n=1 Tax=Pelagimonas sp. KU-00592-HH TaxID=3127651 RepID=UPI0033416341
MENSAGRLGNEAKMRRGNAGCSTDSRKTILSICETAQGGVGRYQESLRALGAQGFDFHILLPDAHREILEDRRNVVTFSRDRRGPGAIYRLIRAVFEQKRRLGPDVLFFNSTFSLLPLFALRLARDRTPAVYCAHCWAVSNYEPTSLKGRLVRFLEGRLCGLADLVVNVSEGDAQLARTFGYRGRHVVVANATPDVAEVQPVALTRTNDDEVQLLFVGRFDRQKGLDILLDAFGKARQRGANVRLHLVGAPVRGSDLPVIPEGVEQHGWVEPGQIDRFFKAADAVIVPSRWEGLPLTIPEALRNGTPVFVSDRSAMPDLIEDGVSGGSFDLSVEALVDCLGRMERGELVEMRAGARATYEARFTMDRFSDALARHLRQVLKD